MGTTRTCQPLESLWLLFPSELNKNANIDATDEEFYIPSFEDNELSNYSVQTLSQEKKSKLLPIAAIATRNNPRIQAQLGVFTINHRDNTAIDNIGDKKHVIKYAIPKTAKANICKELKLLGITKFQLFPELSSIGENLREDLLLGLICAYSPNVVMILTIFMSIIYLIIFQDLGTFIKQLLI